jgi:hypothetical protein
MSPSGEWIYEPKPLLGKQFPKPIINIMSTYFWKGLPGLRAYGFRTVE